MMLTHWTPTREFEDRKRSGWTPSIDVVERKDALVFRAELAGVPAADIDVRVEDNTLQFSGERKREVENGDETAFRRERFFGKFERRFRLPDTIDASKIDAHYRDGVLEVVLPKLERAKPRKVEIRAA
jgi:HSP20 family protein